MESWNDVEIILEAFSIKKYELAQALGINRRTLNDWEHSDLSNDQLNRLQDALVSIVAEIKKKQAESMLEF